MKWRITIALPHQLSLPCMSVSLTLTVNLRPFREIILRKLYFCKQSVMVSSFIIFIHSFIGIQHRELMFLSLALVRTSVLGVLLLPLMFRTHLTHFWWKRSSIFRCQVWSCSKRYLCYAIKWYLFYILGGWRCVMNNIVGNGHGDPSLNLVEFHIAEMHFRKLWNKLFSLQLWPICRTNWAFKPRYVN